ncbi:hypothetical protein GCM10007938_41230 [Vibrio zhanjiangensis]|uniref:Methyltransferase type 12 domain-containing protein n=1 Tax=Vibrio zhanjiangensis TaxID=1046128 RepID=A0ABQ6F513_9VIBR|nr:class I SAM-dependent methyltransferase [Vibrio zhanjiangensis]GLT20339.1 hypothetical protein GCM10007938_41230 [Vibrio zhanjiangensis]
MSIYTYSIQDNFSHRPGNDSIAYSDGLDIESRLYEIISKTQDRSVLSEELANNIVDWPTEYHFSRLRHCLLKHLPFHQANNILELGCGCGAITRFLGETGACIDSVEGTYQRARVAGARCSDLSNVNIFVDDLLKFESNKKYDWVLLIGVLEYAPIFSTRADAVSEYLEVAKRYLKPNGKLVVAIENKLGLKYFNSCSEDHVNQPFFGIENKYSTKTPVTFGRKELSSILENNGFSDLKFFYPFPDYKLPTVVVDDTAFSDCHLKVADLLVGAKARDYSGREFRSFNESFVWPELEKNGLVEELSNSFLVVTSADSIKNKEIAWYYNVNRLRDFTTQTTFYRSDRGLRVSKRRLLNTSISDRKQKYCHVELDEEYYLGESLQHLIEQSWHKTNDFSHAIYLYVDWFKYLVSLSQGEEIGDMLIAGDCIDLTPFNIKVKDDQFEFFDKEWIADNYVSLKWVLFRGLYWSLVKLNSSSFLEINVIDLFREISLRAGFNEYISDDFINECIDIERDFIHYTLGESVNISHKIKKIPEDLVGIEKTLSQLESDNAYLLQQNTALLQQKTVISKALEKYQLFLPIRVIRFLKRMIKQ